VCGACVRACLSVQSYAGCVCQPSALCCSVPVQGHAVSTESALRQETTHEWWQVRPQFWQV